MIYFIKGKIHTDKDSGETETALRRVAIRRHIPLDWHSSAAVSFDRKYFLGYENKDSLQLMRIRRYFQRLMPKLIVRFEKKGDFSMYRIRLSLVSTIIFGLLCILLVLNLTYLARGESPEDLLSVFFAFCAFIVLAFLELFLTRRTLSMAMQA